MTIVDQYILDHYKEVTVYLMAKSLGVSTDLVRSRIKFIDKPPKIYDKPITLSDEMFGLIKLIEDRQTGWAVDVAKQRLVDLQKIINET